MIIKAPAKINLYLEIINKREDGYHNLESIMHTVSLCDTLEFELSDNIELFCSDKDLPTDKTNLVYKTAAKLKEKYNIKKGIKINLTKNIPMGAGLGGGSSDAAATITALNKIWKINAPKEELEQFAATIGADVPFFLTGGTAKISGIGNIVEKIHCTNKYFFILVKPSFGVSTVYAYSKIKFPLTNQRKINKITQVLKNNAFSKEDFRNLVFNRFEEFVFDEYQEISTIKNILQNLGCVSLMSGSGATVFGLVANQEELNSVFDKLQQYNWNIWAVSSFEVYNNSVHLEVQ
ncbi:MAG: 4-(cytidine 5'-diphospho)-2-C-methyl-D-erythritol kinase [Endomicrobiaceae bacterium]|nr:4-(cytidine 5'-diphospho)-2-C-methyl-D-erythritol kinase [Endomicrobiaceae bacterium]